MIKSTFKWLAENKFIKDQVNRLVHDDKYALRFLILANAAKDLINCGFYVYQSLNNKDIPEEKRKFVAALDLTNGMLNITTQIILGFGFTCDRVQNMICNKLFGKVEDKATKAVQARILSHHNDFAADLRVKLLNSVKDIPKGCKKGFKAISTIVITTVIAKRVINPFISTPLASWFKAKYMDKKPNNPAAPSQNPIKNINPANMQLPVNSAVKQRPQVKSLENFNNFVYKGTFHS